MVSIPDITKTMRVEDIPVRVYDRLTHPPVYEDHVPTLTKPVNQGLCGSCWAISTSQCLRDRMLRLDPSAPIPDLSFQFIIDCAKNCVTFQGREGCALDCNGGFLSTSFLFLQMVGTTRDSFFPNRHDDEDGIAHIDGTRGVRGTCPQMIPAHETVFKCDDFYNVHIYPDMFGITNARNPPRKRSPADLKRNADNIAEEIFRNGPVAVCFNLYSDFKDFWMHPDSKNMIYQLGWKLPLGIRRTIPAVGNVNWTEKASMYGIYFKTGHSVSIVGYGVMQTPDEGPVEYWVCRNSWGRASNTLHNGYFRIRRGINCSAIEADICACVVKTVPKMLVEPTLAPSGAVAEPVLATPRVSTCSPMLAIAVFVLLLVLILYFLKSGAASAKYAVVK